MSRAATTEPLGRARPAWSSSATMRQECRSRLRGHRRRLARLHALPRAGRAASHRSTGRGLSPRSRWALAPWSMTHPTCAPRARRGRVRLVDDLPAGGGHHATGSGLGDRLDGGPRLGERSLGRPHRQVDEHAVGAVVDRNEGVRAPGRPPVRGGPIPAARRTVGDADRARAPARAAAPGRGGT